MILEKQDAIYAATKFMKYFENFNRIDDYFRTRKIERVKNIPVGLPGLCIEDDMFHSRLHQAWFASYQFKTS